MAETQGFFSVEFESQGLRFKADVWKVEEADQLYMQVYYKIVENKGEPKEIMIQRSENNGHGSWKQKGPEDGQIDVSEEFLQSLGRAIDRHKN